MNYSELLQLTKGWGNFVSDRINIWRLQHIINYAKTREVYVAYRKAGYSKKFLAEHEGDILLHKAAKKAFDEMGIKKLPTVKSI